MLLLKEKFQERMQALVRARERDEGGSQLFLDNVAKAVLLVSPHAGAELRAIVEAIVVERVEAKLDAMNGNIQKPD